jgi:hypothetical protein
MFALAAVLPVRDARAQARFSDAFRSGATAAFGPARGPEGGVGSRPTGPDEVPVALAAPVVARGAPRSYQVVSVSVPPGFLPDQTVWYDVRSTGLAPILGSKAGHLVPSAVGRPAVLVTVGVPARALAGHRVVAFVRFTAPATAPVDVPVDLDVETERRISIIALQDLHAAHGGDLLELRYRITNAGNATDTVDVRVMSPAGWTVKDASVSRSRLALPVNASAEYLARIRIPASAAGSGTSLVSVVASAHGEERSRAESAVEVLAPAGAGTHRGALLTTGVATVTGADGGDNTMFGASISGPLTEHVAVSGQVSSSQRADGDAARGLARVGYYSSAPYLMIYSPTWRVSLGTTGQSFSDVTGLNAWGRGVAGAYTGSTWTGSALAARPASGVSSATGDGDLYGARVSRLVSDAWITATATHLRDESVFSRRLDAFGLGASVPVMRATTLTGEVAQRDYQGGSGIGYASELRGDSRGTNLALRVSHAPGGSAAFARAEDEVSASVAHSFSPGMLVSGNVFDLRDQSGTFSDLRSHGWSVVPQYRLTPRTDLSFEARSASFDASGTAGSFGSAEMALGATVNTTRGAMYGTGSVLGSRVSRSTVTPGGTSFEERAPRSVLRGAGGWATAHGSLELDASLEQSGAGVGLLPRQSIIGLRADRVPVGRLGVPVYASAGIQRYGWFGDRSATHILRAGLTALLPADFSATIDAERNPLLATGQGTGAWVVALKLERATRLMRFGDRATRGAVYQDLNGNGRRDAGEPGFAGAVVRRGSSSMVTDQDGRFEFTDNVSGAPQLDVRSLPFGWVASGAPAFDGGRSAIGVMPTSTVEVQLVVTASDSSSPPAVDLSPAQVIARDTLGRTWIARVSSSGRALLDALPLGEYTIELDLSLVAEPLRVPPVAPTFTVVGRGRREIRIPLYTRPVRFNVLPNSRRDSSRARGLPAGTSREPHAGDSVRPNPEPTAPAARALIVDTAYGRVARSSPGDAGDANAVDQLPTSALLASPRFAGLLRPYVVRRDDTLRGLATRFLHDEMRWPVLYDLNRSSIRDPDLLIIGQQLTVLALRHPLVIDTLMLPGNPWSPSRDPMQPARP